jgi:hypothetical protein
MVLMGGVVGNTARQLGEVSQFTLSSGGSIVKGIVRFVVQGKSLSLSRKSVPNDSILHTWLDQFAITEVPLSYSILSGLSVIGGSLRRQLWIDDEGLRVWPNLSVLLIGPPGIGKDTIIDAATEVIDRVHATTLIAGKTVEYIEEQLVKLGDPAVCFTGVGELAAFLGPQDYQAGKMQRLTDILSTGRKVDVSTKGAGRQMILHPTMTMIAGSTLPWLRHLPEGSMTGGFVPRFVVTHEDYGKRHVAWVKYDNSQSDLKAARAARVAFPELVRAAVAQWHRAREIVPTADARDAWRNWYRNRFDYFSRDVQEYANRARGQAQKLAMLCAASRMHGWLEQEDYEFSGAVMTHVASSIEKILKGAKQ